ncbi:MAG TPA: DinB family protein [Candidatus Binatia bacterium]|nr:DinB family protein [Candidatus Binatia bacterium]
MTSLLVDFARNNVWANHRLHAACAELGEEALHAPRPSFFGSIHRTLCHILIVDWYYLDALEGGGKGPALYADPEPLARFAEVRAAQRDADRRLIAYAERLDDARLAAPVVLVRDAGERHEERVADVLVHLFQHQIHHRGQVHGLLSTTAVAPPQLDEYFLREDAARRADELRALGLPPR